MILYQPPGKKKKDISFQYLSLPSRSGCLLDPRLPPGLLASPHTLVPPGCASILHTGFSKCKSLKQQLVETLAAWSLVGPLSTAVLSGHAAGGVCLMLAVWRPFA